MNITGTLVYGSFFIFYCWCQLTRPGAFSKPKTRRTPTHSKPRRRPHE